MKDVEMKLVNVEGCRTITTIAHLFITVEVINLDWLVSTARGLLSMDPSANLGVVIAVDGEFFKFYSREFL